MINKVYIVPAVIGGILLIAVPGMADSLFSMISGAPKLCTLAPYAYNCICPPGLDKQFVFGEGLSYVCVPKLLPTPCAYPIEYTELNTEFESKALGCAQAYMEQNYPDCPSLDCSSPLIKDISIVYDAQGQPAYFMVECREPLTATGGQFRWHVTLSLEDGTLHPIIGYGDYCR